MKKTFFALLRTMMFVALMPVLSVSLVACVPVSGAGGLGDGDEGEVVGGGSKAIDLGLSVKWASCNVGADSPEDYGGYYAWGETVEKSEYSWSTYKWCHRSHDSQTKYCTNSDYSYWGRVDNKRVLESADDVAHSKWGGSWRMPTLDEIKELRSQCSWSWTSVKGVNGYRVTGPNGNSIFLPAAGWRGSKGVDGRGSSGNYSSATLGSDDSRAYGLYFYSDDVYWDDSYRDSGLSVRPVTK